MSTPEHPEIPYPLPPMRPTPTRRSPSTVPFVDVPGGCAELGLLDQRKVLLAGPLDADAANRLSAQLMTLDGVSSRTVELFINSSGGGIAEALAPLDVIGLMRAPVGTTCMGTARGTAAALLACGTGERRCTPNATVSLRCSHPEAIEGTAVVVQREAEHLAATRARLRALLARATGQSTTVIDDHLDHGGILDPAQARQLGIVDLIAQAQDIDKPESPGR